MRLYAEFAKVVENDDGTITVIGTASSGTRDEAGELIRPDAMKAALPDYMKFANIREMHDAKAAGIALAADVDGEGFTNIETQIVDPIAITKVKAGVYKGFSVGGKVLARDPTDRSIITKIRLSEISLVDRPCNPDAMIDLWKAADVEPEGSSPMAYAPTNDEIKATAEAMAKAAGKTGRTNDYVVRAREKLIAEHEASQAETAEKLAKADDAAPVTESAAEPEAVEKVDPASPVVEAAEPEIVEPDLADALNAAVEKAATAAAAPADPAAPPAQVTPGLADFAKGLGELIALPAVAENPLAKGLYTVAALAQILDQLSAIQCSTAWEAEYEGDNSTLPADLATSIQALGANLVAMATEEVGELIAEMMDGDGETIIVIDDAFAYAAAVVDLVKADTAVMQKAGARHSKKDMAAIQAMHDKSAELGAKCAGAEKSAGQDDDLAKMRAENTKLGEAVEKALPAIEALTKGLEESKAENEALKKRLEVVEATPAATRVAGSLHAVTKAADASPATAALTLTEEQLAAELAKMSDHDRAMLLTKAALRLPVS